MKRVVDNELKQIMPYFEMAAKEAGKSTCTRGHCGTVIVKDGAVIGRGYNSPPLNDASQRSCEAEWDLGKKPKFDKTCCVHAEWRAIIDACKTNGDKVYGSTLYFMRIDDKGGFTGSGQPFCTVCSRLSMESGISEFVLWHDDGANIYPSAEYNARSYGYYAK